MKLLILTPQLPYPPHQGTSLRNFNIMRGLAGSNRLTLLSFRETAEEPDLDRLGPLVDLCEEIITVPQPPQRSAPRRIRQMVTSKDPDIALRLRSPRFEITLRRLLAEETFDIIQLEGIELAWTISVIRTVSAGYKLVLDAHNAETQLQMRAFQADLQRPRRWPAAAYSWVQSRRLNRYEAWACTAANYVTVVSRRDQDILHKQLGNEEVKITVIPNSIDVAQYEAYGLNNSAARQTGTNRFDLVFTGKMDYRPNVDAVLWFAEEVWPVVIAARPETTWAVVGQKPHARLTRLKDVRGVTLTGWVEDIMPYLRGGKVFVMPFRVGSGTRLKFVEALAMGIPVVSTSLGVEGYVVENERELLLAESAQDMAAAILRLLAEPETRKRLVESGRALARNYDWREVTPKFDEVYHALVD